MYKYMLIYYEQFLRKYGSAPDLFAVFDTLWSWKNMNIADDSGPTFA